MPGTSRYALLHTSFGRSVVQPLARSPIVHGIEEGGILVFGAKIFLVVVACASLRSTKMTKGVDGVGGKGCQEVDEGEAHLCDECYKIMLTCDDDTV